MAKVPLGKKISKSKFSITRTLEEKNAETPAEAKKANEKHLPKDHFSETDLKAEWQEFLKRLKVKDVIIYRAIKNFILHKEDEDTVCVKYSSELAKTEFDKVRTDFFNHFQTKVNHYNINIIYKTDPQLKQEIITKRKIFDRFVEINPVLKDLNDLLDFDLS